MHDHATVPKGVSISVMIR